MACVHIRGRLLMLGCVGDFHGVRKIFASLFFFSSRRRHTRFDCDWSSDVCSSDLTIAIKASTPPSPLLSARMITMWYLIVTTITSDQNTIDRTPSTFPGVTLMPWGPENE